MGSSRDYAHTPQGAASSHQPPAPVSATDTNFAISNVGGAAKAELANCETNGSATSMDACEKALSNADKTDMKTETDGKKAWEEGNYAEAVARWERSLKSIDYIFSKAGYKEGTKQYIDTLAIKKKTHLNVAQGYIKLRQFDKAVDACEIVLKEESTHEKALFRKAAALQGQTSYQKCLDVIQELLTAHPGNKAAEQLQIEVAHADAKFKKESKSRWQKVMGTMEHDERVPPTAWEKMKDDLQPKRLYQRTMEMLSDFKQSCVDHWARFKDDYCQKRNAREKTE